MKRAINFTLISGMVILIIAESFFMFGPAITSRAAKESFQKQRLQSAASIVLFSDNFDRPDDSLIGNDWIELEAAGAVAELSGGRVCFPDTSDASNLPLIAHTFPQKEAGQLIWEFDFDWKRIRAEKRYNLFLQLGEGMKMSGQSQDSGIGVNLIWTVVGNTHELLAYRRQGVLIGLQVISGAARLRIEADLASKSYQVFVNGLLIAQDIPFDQDVKLDTVRYFTDGLNEAYFSGRCFDNLIISAVESSATETSTATVSPVPTLLPSETPTNTPTFLPSFTPSPMPTDTFTPAWTQPVTETPTETLIPQPSETLTPTLTATSLPTQTPTETFTLSPSETFTATWTQQATATSTPAPSQTPAFPSTHTPTPTFSPTPTPSPTEPSAPEPGSWPMAGANPARTSWTSTEVRGALRPLWYRPFETYIMQKVQIITAYGNLYISTAKGLYALDASTGNEKWVYPTQLPLGHSPTVYNGMVFVGGFDHKIHAIDALSGQGLWTFTGGAGFDTNPLVVDGILYAGNRDGYFYAIDAEGENAGQLVWRYKTQGPIDYSAAYHDGVVYFASNDSHAYALDARTGELIWRSDKLPGAGFHSWWPVIYGDYVIFSGSNNYRTSIKPGPGLQFTYMELVDVYPNRNNVRKGTPVGPLGYEPGPWVAGSPTIDMSASNQGSTPVTEYFEAKPWRRTYFVLNRSDGMEITFDFDQDGKAEYAPILWFGTHSGNRYPPVVGGDGVIYQANNYLSDRTIAGGHISGWAVGTPFISIVNGGWNAVDEPVGYAAGGNLIYWNRCCDRYAGAFDVSIPENQVYGAPTPPPGSSPERKWRYFSYNLPDLVPGYNIMTFVTDPYDSPFGGVYGGRNGSYGFHGDVNPPIPYQGMVFMHRSNAIIAFAPTSSAPVQLPLMRIVDAPDAEVPPLGLDQALGLLQSEVWKILEAGHLRPGYSSTGIFDLAGRRACGVNLVDYFHNPAETLVTLIRALPYLPLDMQEQVKDYLVREMAAYPTYKYDHIGWREGGGREAFDLPPDVEIDLVNHGSQAGVSNFSGWTYSPYIFYGLWKYAQTFEGQAKALFDSSKTRLNPLPSDAVLLEMPHVHNAYIAGYLGYLELEKMAGYPESATVREALNHLLELRASQFSIELLDAFFPSKISPKAYCRNLSAARNFMYLTPELADYLKRNAFQQVERGVEELTRVNPLWFVPKSETAFAEGVINQLYDYNAIFQAKALILGEPVGELMKYLDIPGFAVGDLFYIQNLISVIESFPTQASQILHR